MLNLCYSTSNETKHKLLLMELEKLNNSLLRSKAKQWISSSDIILGELSVIVKAPNIVEMLQFLRDNKQCQFQSLISICGVDYPQRQKRFELVYNLLSLTLNHRLKVKINIEGDDIVPSVISVFSSAGWYEREAWDLFGVMFKNNLDLRRILTDYGFEGHPLRKDFPLSGHTEVRYDLARKAVVYEKMHLTQEFRNFDFTSPWEGTNYVLPGDEKAI